MAKTVQKATFAAPVKKPEEGEANAEAEADGAMGGEMEAAAEMEQMWSWFDFVHTNRTKVLICNELYSIWSTMIRKYFIGIYRSLIEIKIFKS